MNEQTIFTAAVERLPAERAAFLDEACGADHRLRERVEKLIALHEQGGSFLEPPAAGSPATLDRPLSERPGTQIGSYRLLQQIGEGGFGIVFMAEQIEPVRRRVALKVIKPGMDTRQVIARFEAERQALAVMDHPNIARVLDAGATESGRPYFVMELVRGTPITQYCDENNLPVRERLELFASVCQAIQHAHTKGIIHRDIKPTNVLVTRHDGQSVVKVIDFGIAKAMGQQLTEKTLFTDFAQMIGTPLYMSPEQAELSSNDIDTRSDIYSLGVLLYELLTGSTPVSKEQLKQAAFDEIRRIIREDEAEKPSTRISGADAAPSIAAQRHTEPGKLARLVRGELDWIVLKALEKDRSRRYETASGFAADVMRYLHDEHVLACPPSAGYRFRKLARRNMAALITAALITTSLFLGTVVSTWQAVRATRAETLAQQRLQTEVEQRALAQNNAAEANKQRRLAEQNFRKAQDAVDQMLTRVADERLPDVPQLEQLRRELYEDALRFNQGFLEERSTDPAVRVETARSYRQLAYIYRFLRDHGKAEAMCNKAIALFEELAAEFPSQPEFRRELARSSSMLATALEETESRIDDAEKAALRAIRLDDRLTAEFPNDSEYRAGLARSYLVLGHVLARTNRHQEREHAYRRALDLHGPLAKESPDDVSYRHERARCYASLGEVLANLGQIAEAETALQEAILLLRQLISEFPQAPLYRKALGHTLHDWARVLVKDGRHTEGEEAHAEAVSLFERLAADFPSVTFYWMTVGGYSYALGGVQQNLGRKLEAAKTFQKSLEVKEKVADDAPELTAFRTRLSDNHAKLADRLKAASRSEEAEQMCLDAIAFYERLAEKFPKRRSEHQARVAQMHQILGDTLKQRDRPQDAQEHYLKGLAILTTLVADFPVEDNYRQQRAFLFTASGDLHKQLGKTDLALADYSQAIELQPQNGTLWEKRGRLHFDLRQRDKAVADFSQVLDLAPSNAMIWNVRGLAHLHSGTPDKALADITRAIELEPGRATHWVSRGQILEDGFQDYDQAILAYSEAIKLNKGNVAAWIWHRRGASYARLCRWEQAVADCNQGLELDPKHATLFLERAKCLVALGRYEAAGDDYRSAYESAPKSGPTQNALAWFLATCPDERLRDPKRAVELANNLVKRAPKERPFWNTFGLAQYRAGNWKGAIVALEKSAELGQGGDANDWFFLAMAHWQLGEKDKAVEWYDRAVQWMNKNQPTNEELLRFRAEAAELLAVKNEKD